MPARVFHFGPDDCHRLMVLESAGYAVQECNGLVELRRMLADSARADALLVTEGDEVPLHDIVALVRSQSSLPIILFRNPNMAREDAGVDLVVHCLTPPDVWLNDVEAVIEKTRDPLRA